MDAWLVILTVGASIFFFHNFLWFFGFIRTKEERKNYFKGVGK